MLQLSRQFALAAVLFLAGACAGSDRGASVVDLPCDDPCPGGDSQPAEHEGVPLETGGDQDVGADSDGDGDGDGGAGDADSGDPVELTCSDGVLNGNETDIDCGGGRCPLCADHLACARGVDCLSGGCAVDRCAPSACGWDVSESFGADANPTGEPIGGGDGYSRQVTQPDTVVHTKAELLAALAGGAPGSVIFVQGTADIDLSGEDPIELTQGVTLASDRGAAGAPGALLFSDELKTFPMFKVVGSDARITGLRLRGPDPDTRESAYEAPNSRGVQVEASRVEIDNNEIFAFSHAGVITWEGVTDVHVHHNNIHHCQRAGLGYGVSGSGQSLIEANTFDWTRHAIAGSGRAGNGYEARYNIIGANRIGTTFDMHGAHDFEKRITAANWRMDEGLGSNVEDRSHSCNHDCSFTNMDASAWVSGRINSGLRFDGVDDRLTCVVGGCTRYLTGLVAPEGTVTFWLSPESFSNQGDVLNIFEDGYQNYVLLRVDERGRVRVTIDDDDVRQLGVGTTESLVLDQFQHVAVVQDGEGIQIFVNGEPMSLWGENGGAWTGHLDLTGIWIGGGHWGNFHGVLDEVRVYARALSIEDIERQAAGNADIAGDYVRIHHNTVNAAGNFRMVGIRGIPVQGAWIHHNRFSAVTPEEDLVQRHASGQFHVFQNEYGDGATMVCGF